MSSRKAAEQVGPRRTLPQHRQLTIVAQDPSIPGDDNDVLLAKVSIPAEELRRGPWGYRVQVVDYDAMRGKSYRRAELGGDHDPLDSVDRATLLADPRLHSVNCYALVMRTLSRFERALGRRVSWGFSGHHLNVVPHAFAEANAYYSRDDHALLFGHFPSSYDSPDVVFTCLSHDVVVHETTHAVLDGLRPRFLAPSSPDQAAFHEGFADVVALLSVFSLPGVVEAILRHALGGSGQMLEPVHLTKDKLKRNGLLSLAEELGQELQGIRGKALRSSLELAADPSHYRATTGQWILPHRRGEILVAAVLNTFVDSWFYIVQSMIDTHRVPRAIVAAEGARVADVLLTMVMRAIDYTPPVHLEFSDFLTAMLTIDTELWPQDDNTKYRLRHFLTKNFASFGIEPATSLATDGGCWQHPDKEMRYERNHHEQMRAEPDEVFRFIWENRQALRLNKQAYSRVRSVRPVVRVGTDGFILREVVVEHLETLKVRAKDLRTVHHPDKAGHIEKPEGMPDDLELTLHGGGTMVFDDFGLLKYHISNGVGEPRRQSRRLEHLWSIGHRFGAPARSDFDALHRARSQGSTDNHSEVW